ncbi:unnamed protein product, partial [Prorocentrum cordatum]
MQVNMPESKTTGSRVCTCPGPGGGPRKAGTEAVPWCPPRTARRRRRGRQKSAAEVAFKLARAPSAGVAMQQMMLQQCQQALMMQHLQWMPAAAMAQMPPALGMFPNAQPPQVNRRSRRRRSGGALARRRRPAAGRRLWPRRPQTAARRPRAPSPARTHLDLGPTPRPGSWPARPPRSPRRRTTRLPRGAPTSCPRWPSRTKRPRARPPAAAARRRR